MESYRRLKSPNWIHLTWICIAFSLVGCESTETPNQPEMNRVAPGVDPFCNTRPKLEFCEDFDTQDLPGAFDEQSANLSTMTLDNDEASSIPRSLVVSVESGGHGELSHPFEKGGKLRLFGMLYVSELGEGEVEIGSFKLGDYRVGFGVSEDGSLWGYEGENRIDGNGSIPIGKWASFRWDVNLYDDGTGKATLRFGNDYIVDTDELSTPIESDESPVATVGLSNATGTWTMRFDNLTVAIKEAVQ